MKRHQERNMGTMKNEADNRATNNIVSAQTKVLKWQSALIGNSWELSEETRKCHLQLILQQSQHETDLQQDENLPLTLITCISLSTLLETAGCQITKLILMRVGGCKASPLSLQLLLETRTWNLLLLDVFLSKTLHTTLLVFIGKCDLHDENQASFCWDSQTYIIQCSYESEDSVPHHAQTHSKNKRSTNVALCDVLVITLWGTLFTQLLFVTHLCWEQTARAYNELIFFSVLVKIRLVCIFYSISGFTVVIVLRDRNWQVYFMLALFYVCSKVKYNMKNNRFSLVHQSPKINNIT